MTYTQEDFERDAADVEYHRAQAELWKRELSTTVARAEAAEAENERLTELMKWREGELADRHASLVYALTARAEAAEAENERLLADLEYPRDWFEVEALAGEHIAALTARAEAAEKHTRFIASERQYGAVSMRFEYADGSSNSYPLAAWDATTPLHANTADVTVRDHPHEGSQLASDATSAACEEGAE